MQTIGIAEIEKNLGGNRDISKVVRSLPGVTSASSFRNDLLIRGGTIEAIGAIHFADADLRQGRRGITPEMLYLELQIHGENKKAQIEKLGIRAGDPVILNRPIRHGFSPDTFYGAYLDNGLGCFVVMEALKLLAESGGLKNVRFLGAAASYEEIGRFGSRVLAQEFRPDVSNEIEAQEDDFLAYAEHLHQRGDLNENTVVFRLKQLRPFYQQAIKQEWIFRDPMLNLKIPKRNERVPLILRIDEMKRLLEDRDKKMSFH